MLCTKIKVELSHRTKSGPPQCQNGHTTNYCHHTSWCVKCEGDHSSEIFQKQPNKCKLCAGDLTSNYKDVQNKMHYSNIMQRVIHVVKIQTQYSHLTFSNHYHTLPKLPTPPWPILILILIIFYYRITPLTITYFQKHFRTLLVNQSTHFPPYSRTV